MGRGFLSVLSIGVSIGWVGVLQTNAMSFGLLIGGVGIEMSESFELKDLRLQGSEISQGILSLCRLKGIEGWLLPMT
jgi:hypothetical protein